MKRRDFGVGLRSKGRLILFDVVLLAVLSTPTLLFAQINNICYPDPIGVPGMSHQAPNWVAGAATPHRTELDDPRWNGAMRFSFDQVAPAGGGPDVSEATVKGLVKDGKLYLSYEILVDPQGPYSGGDAIYFGLGPRTINSTDKAYLVRIELNTNDETLVASPGQVNIRWFSRKTDSSNDWGPLGPSAPAAVSSDAVWTSSDTWAINFVIDLSAVTVTAPYKTFYGINTQFTPFTFAQHSLPVCATFDCDDTNNPQPGLSSIMPADWLNTWIGTSEIGNCPEGISISSNQIGSTNANPSTIVKGSDNTFFANPSYGTAYTALPANRIKARYRLANWGSQIGETDAPWSEVATGTNAAAVDGGGIEGTCYATEGDANANGGKVCPNPDSDGIITHQCMLVELAGLGNSKVSFTRSAAYRNMNFVSSSVFTRNAEISVDGLKPIPGKSGRDVYVYVRTKNMPKKSTKRFKLKLRDMAKLSAKVNRRPRIERGFWKKEMKRFNQRLKKGAKSMMGRGAQKKVPRRKIEKPIPTFRRVIAGQAPFGEDRLHTHYEKLIKVWPTYEVHVYHETGEMLKRKGRNMKRVNPQLPFGYHVTHNRAFYGFEHELHGISGSVVEKIGDNFYRMHVPNRGVARLKTRISSVEKRPAITPRKFKPRPKGPMPHKPMPKKPMRHNKKVKKTSSQKNTSKTIEPEQAGMRLFGLADTQIWSAAGILVLLFGAFLLRRKP